MLRHALFPLRHVLAILLLIALYPTSASAQPPFGGGPGFGRDRGDRGRDRGGRDRGGDRESSGPSSFLTRMDRNGDGMIAPDEMDERARGFLSRIASEAKIDLSRPVPISRLSEAFEKMRNSWRGRSSSSSSSDSDSKSEEEEQPLVQGFDLPPLTLPPGFGENAELSQIVANEKDMRYAEDRMRRYDRNKDGVLDAQELQSGRWSDDPMRFDRSGDGKLTAAELAIRYAKRRLDASGDSDSSDSKSKPEFFTGVTSSASVALDDRTKRMLDYTMGRYDRNRDGVVDEKERKEMRSDPSEFDANKDSKISKAEMAKFLQERYGSRSSSRNRSSAPNYFTGRPADSSDSKDADAYWRPTRREQLEEDGKLKDLPSGFLDADEDGDGQVSMAEYAEEWTDAMAEAFIKMDSNNDGYMTIQECLAARKEGVSWNGTTSSDSSDSEVEVGDDPDRSGSRRSGSSSTTSSKPSKAPAGAGDIPPVYLRYSQSLIKKYDENEDGVLTKDEWAKMTKPPEDADTDKDGKITDVEMARFRMK